jgi:hypothetical protein
MQFANCLHVVFVTGKYIEIFGREYFFKGEFSMEKKVHGET